MVRIFLKTKKMSSFDTVSQKEIYNEKCFPFVSVAKDFKLNKQFQVSKSYNRPRCHNEHHPNTVLVLSSEMQACTENWTANTGI